MSLLAPSGHAFDTAAGIVQKPDYFHLGYRPWVDGLRGLAILMVLGFHFRLVRGGWLGVDIFFVLSGFLITTLLAQEWRQSSSIRLRQFYLRRALRLFPALFALLLIDYLAIRQWRPAEAPLFLKEILVVGCYVTNWPALHPAGMVSLGHTWSLSLEEQFYLIWPVLLLILLRSAMKRRRILFLLCAGILASAVTRELLYLASPPAEPERGAYRLGLYMGLHTRADALLVGCLVGLMASWGLLPRSERFRARSGAAALLCAAALGFLLIRSVASAYFFHGLFTGAALMVAVILTRLLVGRAGFASRILEFSPLVGIGRISYGLYLVHIPILTWLHPSGLGWSYPGNTLLAAGLSFAAALVSYFCVERPCLRIKDRLHAPRPQTQPSRSGEGSPLSVAA